MRIWRSPLLTTSHKPWILVVNMLQKERFREAVKAAGGLAKVAEATGVKSASVVSNWADRGIPIKKCRAFSDLTGIPMQELHDDWREIWPELAHDTESV